MVSKINERLKLKRSIRISDHFVDRTQLFSLSVSFNVLYSLLFPIRPIKPSVTSVDK